MSKVKKKGFWEFGIGWYRNWIKGCPEGCKYCYGMLKEVCRLKRISDIEAWQDWEYREKVLNEKVKPLEGTGMVPSTHNIFPEILEESLIYFERHLEVGNKLLIVLKPYKEVVREICKEFSEYRDQIEFRFTITTLNEATREFWEPNATNIEERIDCLKISNHLKFKTSVSIGPFLDKNPTPLIERVFNHATEIWLEPMNHLVHIKKIIGDCLEYNSILKICSIENLVKIVRKIKSTSKLQEKVRFKEPFELALKLANFHKIDKWVGGKS